jgi:uncharacterized membrane-anchored protein
MSLRVTISACSLLFAAIVASPAAGQQPDQQRLLSELKKLDWQVGPSTGKISDEATISLPAHYLFLSAADTSKFLVLMQNLPESNAYTVAPSNLEWFSIFNFENVGYVSDNDKIDADAVLQSLKENEVAANEERKKRGFSVLYLDGWFVPPHYDEQTKRLEWATRLRSGEGDISVNYKISFLGRSGVMSALLVSDPDSLDKDVRSFKEVLNGFSFNAGQKYTEFRSGDRIAEYGLTGLIVGGAAAAAAKTGLFKVIAKFAIYIVAGGAALVASLFKAIFGQRKKAT